jgi:hypothetical protein
MDFPSSPDYHAPGRNGQRELNKFNRLMQQIALGDIFNDLITRTNDLTAKFNGLIAHFDGAAGAPGERERRFVRRQESAPAYADQSAHEFALIPVASIAMEWGASHRSAPLAFLGARLCGHRLRARRRWAAEEPSAPDRTSWGSWRGIDLSQEIAVQPYRRPSDHVRRRQRSLLRHRGRFDAVWIRPVSYTGLK